MHIHLVRLVELFLTFFFPHLDLIPRIVTVAFSGLNCVHGRACTRPMCEFIHIRAKEVPALCAYTSNELLM